MGKHKKSTIPAPPPESFHLPQTGVESHAHLNDRRFQDDFDSVLQRCRDTGLARIGQIFLSADAWEEDSPKFLPHSEFFFALGIHPTEAALYTHKEKERLKAIYAHEPRIKAVGEIGLDYYWKDCPPDVQKKVFAEQLDTACALNLPVVIHCRNAEEDTLKLLEERQFKDYPLLWHCFGGDARLADHILNNGWHISIPGPVTYPSNELLREAVRLIPAERLMMETDSPYLPPMPHRGERNEPAYLAFTIQTMAQSRGVSPEDLWTSCGRTACAFFKLEPPQ